MATRLNPAAPLEPRELSIADVLDCATAQQCARHMALALGFSEPASEEVVLAVAELAANLVRHAGQGLLTVRPLQAAMQSGIEIETEDRGPGIEDIESSFADGYSTRGGLGYGMGTVNRLMDEMDVSSEPGLRTRIVARRFLRPAAEFSGGHVWETGAATRSRRFDLHNGDAFVIREWQGNLLAGVIDGLGHGEDAHRAALAAQRYVQTHYDLPLDKIFSGAGRACRGTRGVVMALARFSPAGKMSFASLGNIEARAWRGGPELVRLEVQRGILGINERTVSVYEHPWNSKWTLVLHSDGVSSHWQWHDFPTLERESPQMVAGRLLRSLASENDDATVVVARGRGL
ncbi:MAG TPA: ATP-binding SpoIIE family protein phosphatase [Candidatus Angelobacter sp.]|nr:ATP-binding SpoIIE family protein phosphatase [Candidatus Angelobacter sp.]